MSAPRSRAGLLAASLGLRLLLPGAWLLAHLPPAVGLAAGRRLGDVLWWVLPRRRAVALDNLQRSLGGERSPAEIRRLARRSFQHVGMNLVEACCYLLRPTHVMLSRVRMEGREHFQAAASQGRGVLVLTAHFGNWELLAAAHGLSGLPLSIVTRPLDHPLLDDLAARFRCRSGAELIVKRQAVREVLTALKRQRMVGILLDQNATRAEGVFVPFFGALASTSKGLALLALRTGAPVVPVFLRREPGGRHCMDVGAALPPPEDGLVTTYTTAFNRVLEEAIRRAPEQWLWMHDRWRTRPRETVPS
ncbi:MAG TPA: lysophospholipid acyltransferase family protein [Candidatus Limnocylindria bacterium]|nr:lysophospholipid acyltransferase family protein [Candidatus Limnocylindria bacterium]